MYCLAGISKKQLMVSKTVTFVSCVIVVLTWKQRESPIAISAPTAFLSLFQPLAGVVMVAAVFGVGALVLPQFSLGSGFESMHILLCFLMLVTLSFTLLPSRFPGTYLFSSSTYFGFPTKLVL